MLVLNNRFSLLASLLASLILSSTSPAAIAHGAVIRAVRDTEGPSTTTLADGTVYIQKPFHQDRPSELDLPEGAEPSSAASRKGMGQGGRRGGDGSKAKTWTGTWAGTKTWARPASTGNPAPASKGGDGDDNEDVSKRDFTQAKQGVVIQRAHRKNHARRSSQRGLMGKHRFGRHFRRDISIDSDHGDHYVVQKDRTRTPSSAYRQQRFMVRRKVSKGTPGVINIMSHVNNAQTGKKIAALYLESEKQNDQYVLNASEKDSTEVYLVPTVPPSGGSHTTQRRGEDSKVEMLVSLRVEIDGQEYCATYDPNPPEAEPLTMQPCMEAADESSVSQKAKDVDLAKDRDPDNHKSQTFSFNPDSGVIRPMWFAGEDDGKTDDAAHASDASDDSASSSISSASPAPTVADSDDAPSSSAVSSAVAAAEDTSLPTSVVPSPSSDPASAASATPTTSITAREPGAAQNVTLVFVPSPKAGAKAVGDASSSSVLASAPLPSASGASSSDDSASAVPSQSASAASDDADSTSVFTKTVTVTAGAEPTAAEASLTESSGASTTPTPTAEAADDDAASSTTTITISSSALPSAAPSNGGDAQGSLSVQVVGDDGKTVGDDDPSTSTPPMDSDDSAASSVPASAGAAAASSASASAGPTPTAPLPAVPLITKAPAPPVNPMAVASEVAQSWSASQSAAAAAETDSASQSATPSQSAPDALKSQIVAVKDSRTINSRIVRRQLTPVSTAPYKWLFKLGGI